MTREKSKQLTPRGTDQVWLEAAYDVLCSTGIEAVRVLILSKRLKLSRTSFYWFFKDRDALLAALLDRWRNKNTQNLIRQTSAYAETVAEAVFNVFDCWFDRQLFDSRFEFAVRNWAQQDKKVAEEIDKADAARIGALTEMFVRFGFSAVHAYARGRTLYLTQIGYISMKARESLDTRMARIPSVVELYCGKPPTANEFGRFCARHQFQPRDPGLLQRAGRASNRARTPVA